MTANHLPGFIVSDCCGEVDRLKTNSEIMWSEVGLCPSCMEHCSYIDPTEQVDNLIKSLKIRGTK